MSDPILNSFEIAAEKTNDLTESIYKRCFANCPGSEELMQHIDIGVRGKMIQEVLRLILVENYDNEEGYLNFEVKYHKESFKVQKHMYSNLLNAVHAVLKESIQADWTEEFEFAWKRRIGNLVNEIENRHAAGGSGH